jgi:hypothetical protein
MRARRFRANAWCDLCDGSGKRFMPSKRGKFRHVTCLCARERDSFMRNPHRRAGWMLGWLDAFGGSDEPRQPDPVPTRQEGGAAMMPLTKLEPRAQPSLFDTDPKRANEFIWNLVVELDMYAREYLSRGEPEPVEELRRAIREAAEKVERYETEGRR